MSKLLYLVLVAVVVAIVEAHADLTADTCPDGSSPAGKCGGVVNAQCEDTSLRCIVTIGSTLGMCCDLSADTCPDGSSSAGTCGGFVNAPCKDASLSCVDIKGSTLGICCDLSADTCPDGSLPEGTCGGFVNAPCKDASLSCLYPSSSSLGVCCDKCTLPAKPGPCEAYFERWYYDANAGKCKTFIYGGCQGNANRFGSKKKCKKACEPECPNNLVMGYCVSSGCTATCDDPKPQVCTTDCVDRCVCPEDKPILHKGKCIKEKKCPVCPATCDSPFEGPCHDGCPSKCRPSCPKKKPVRIDGKCSKLRDCMDCPAGSGMVVMGCQSSICEPTCDNPNPPCTDDCVTRCVCPKHRPLFHEGKCINAKKCPPPPPPPKATCREGCECRECQPDGLCPSGSGLTACPLADSMCGEQGLCCCCPFTLFDLSCIPKK